MSFSVKMVEKLAKNYDLVETTGRKYNHNDGFWGFKELNGESNWIIMLDVNGDLYVAERIFLNNAHIIRVEGKISVNDIETLGKTINKLKMQFNKCILQKKKDEINNRLIKMNEDF